MRIPVPEQMSPPTDWPEPISPTPPAEPQPPVQAPVDPPEPLPLGALVRDLDWAIASRDWTGFRALLAADFVHRDRRGGLKAFNDVDETVEAERQASTLFGRLNRTTIVAERAPNMVARRGDYGPAGARVMSFVAITAFDDDGRVARTDTFDIDRIDHALAELDRWHRLQSWSH